MKGEGEGKKETLGAFFKIVGFAGKRFLLSPPPSFFFFARAQFLRFERHLGPAWRIVLDLMLGRWDLVFTCAVETTAQTQQTLYFCFVQPRPQGSLLSRSPSLTKRIAASGNEIVLRAALSLIEGRPFSRFT